MKKMLVLLTISVIIFACSPVEKVDSRKNYTNIITKYTELKQIISKEVDDTFYVFIRLPKNYSTNTNKSYPVLYLLDGDISFNMATSVVRYLQFSKSVPDLIIVAPAYGTMLSDNETNFRERDYTTSKVQRFPESGGGENYLRFLRKELIPSIDSSYRTNNKRILNGYSLGGLFAINTLLNNPDLFTDYIVGSPYLINNLDSIKAKIQTFFLNDEKRLFISVGKLEGKKLYKTPIKSIFNLIKSKNNLSTEFRIFEKGTHFICPSEALSYGLSFVFKQTNSVEQDF